MTGSFELLKETSELMRLRARIAELEAECARLQAAADRAARPAPPHLSEVDAPVEQLVDALVQGVARFDAQERLMFANRAFLESHGSDLAVLRGRSLRELLGAGVYARVRPKVDDVLCGRPTNFDITVTVAGLDQRLRTHYIPDVDGEGRIQGFYALIESVSGPVNQADRSDRAQALYERTERLARLGHYEWDELEDRCIYCSKELARLHGYTVEEFYAACGTTEDDLQAVHPDDRARYTESVKSLRRDGLAFDMEYRLLQASGAVIDVREVLEPVFDQHGRLVRSIGYLQDVTARKRADRALRDSEQRFKDFADASAHWLWEMGPDLRFTYISDGITKLTGERPEDFIGKTRREIAGATPANPESLAANLAQMERHEAFEDFLFDRPNLTGGRVYLSLSGKPVFEPDGRFAGYRGTARDVTERTRMLEEMHQRDAFLRQAAQIANLGHWVWDVERDVGIYCSDALARIYGITVEQYQADYSKHEFVLTRVHPEDRDHYDAVIDRAWSRIEVYDVEYREYLPNGDLRFFRERGEPILDDKGKHVRTIGILQDITKEKEADEALRKSEALLQQAAQIANLGHWAWDEDLDRCVYCSEGLARMNGTTADEYLANHGTMEAILQSIHPNDRERYREVVSRGAKHKDSYELEFRKLMPDGTVRHFLERADPVLDDRGRHVRTIGILQDITKDKEAEDALRRSEAALAEAQRVAKLGHWHWSIETNELISWSEEYSRIHGVPYDLTKSHLSRQMECVVHPDDRERVAREFKRVDDHGLDYEIEYRILLPDHEIRHVLEIGEAVIAADGRPVAHSGTIQDITERKLAEEALQRAHDELESRVRRRTAELSRANQALKKMLAENERTVRALRQSEEQIRVITDSLPALIVLIDPDKRYRFVNRTYETWYQQSSADILGQPIVKVIGPDRYRQVSNYLDSALSGEQVAFEAPVTFPDGKTRHLSGVYVPQYGEDGQVQNVIGIASDMTDRKRAEEELKQAQKMDAVGKLTGGVAHDFNNLLFVIQGSLVLLEHEIEASEETAQAIGSIKAAAELGADLTRSLLAFSRQQPLDPVPVDLTAAIAGTVKTILRTLAPEIQIKTSFVGDVWPIMIDRHQLENAILNLALNAKDAMVKPGELRITAENYTLADGTDVSADFVKLTVADNGSGMAPDVVDRAFEPFFTTKPTGAGTGLGLSMVYGFVIQSRGHIDIQSHLGQGTTVTMYLPRAETESDDGLEGLDAPEAVEGGDETILVTEDGKEVRQVAVKILRRLGYRALEAKDGREALTVLRQEPEVDLLFTDVVLPGDLDGYQLAAEAKSLRADLEVLFCTGYSAQGDTHCDLALPGATLIAKPYEPDQLGRLVRGLLDKAKATRSH